MEYYREISVYQRVTNIYIFFTFTLLFRMVCHRIFFFNNTLFLFLKTRIAFGKL